MNTNKDKLKRLLRSYPVAVVKKELNLLKLNQIEAIDKAVEENTANTLKDFAISNFGYLKQHVRIYDIKNVKQNDITMPNGREAFKSWKSGNSNYYAYLFPVNYKYLDLRTKKTDEISFVWPVILRFTHNKLLVFISVLERNIDAYTPNKVIVLNRSLEEPAILNSILQSIQPIGKTINSCDLTKGIKELWKDDEIDSPKVKFKKSKSTSTEAMDEGMTLKTQYPKIYNTIMKNPLNKTLFHYIGMSNDYSLRFNTEPQLGKVHFPIFGSSVDCVENTVDYILSKN